MRPVTALCLAIIGLQVTQCLGQTKDSPQTLHALEVLKQGAADHEPEQALMLWMERYLDFIATKRGLAKSLHTEG